MTLPEGSLTRKVAAAGMLGMAAISGTACKLPPPIPAANQVHCVVLDEFPSLAESYGVSHGTLVEWVLENQAKMDCARVQVALGSSTQVLDQLQPDGLEKYVVQRFSVPARATAEALQTLMTQQPGPMVASQSQGASQSRVIEALWNRTKGSPEFRSYLEQQLGLQAGADNASLLQSLVQRVDQLHRTHPEILEARSQVRARGREATQQGIVRVLSAGNQGQLSRELDQLGVVVPRNFYLNDLDHGSAIVVGASDHRQTPEASDDGPALLASPDAGALVGAQGVDVPILVRGQPEKHSGSSYAQPQVAAQILQWLQAEPSLSQEQIEHRLLEAARPIPGAESYLGAGILDGEWKLTPS